MSAYPPIAFPPLPPTSNTLSPEQRSALVHSSRKLSKVLGDVPHVLDDIPRQPFTPSGPCLELTRTHTSSLANTESTWRKRKPTHLPPLLNLSTGCLSPHHSPTSPMDSIKSPVSTYHYPATHYGSVLSVVPSIVSNSSSTASSCTASEASADSTQRRVKLERLRRKLGDEVPITAIFPSPTTPRTAVPAPRTPKTRTSSSATPHTRMRSRTRSVARLPSSSRAEDAHSVTFSISSDESVQTVTFTAAHIHSPRPHKTQRAFHAGGLPPVPSIPAHFLSTASSPHDNDHDDDAGFIRPRQKMAAGSKIGGPDFKAARRAKREARAQNGRRTAEPGELVEMVGFLL